MATCPFLTQTLSHAHTNTRQQRKVTGNVVDLLSNQNQGLVLQGCSIPGNFSTRSCMFLAYFHFYPRLHSFVHFIRKRLSRQCFSLIQMIHHPLAFPFSFLCLIHSFHFQSIKNHFHFHLIKKTLKKNPSELKTRGMQRRKGVDCIQTSTVCVCV